MLLVYSSLHRLIVKSKIWQRVGWSRGGGCTQWDIWLILPDVCFSFFLLSIDLGIAWILSTGVRHRSRIVTWPLVLSCLQRFCPALDLFLTCPKHLLLPYIPFLRCWRLGCWSTTAVHSTAATWQGSLLSYDLNHPRHTLSAHVTNVPQDTSEIYVLIQFDNSVKGTHLWHEPASETSSPATKQAEVSTTHNTTVRLTRRPRPLANSILRTARPPGHHGCWSQNWWRIINIKLIIAHHNNNDTHRNLHNTCFFFWLVGILAPKSGSVLFVSQTPKNFFVVSFFFDQTVPPWNILLSIVLNRLSVFLCCVQTWCFGHATFANEFWEKFRRHQRLKGSSRRCVDLKQHGGAHAQHSPATTFFSVSICQPVCSRYAGLCDEQAQHGIRLFVSKLVLKGFGTMPDVFGTRPRRVNCYWTESESRNDSIVVGVFLRHHLCTQAFSALFPPWKDWNLAEAVRLKCSTSFIAFQFTGSVRSGSQLASNRHCPERTNTATIATTPLQSLLSCRFHSSVRNCSSPKSRSVSHWTSHPKWVFKLEAMR